MSAAYGQPGAADRPEAMRLYPWGESWEPGRCNITGTDTTGTPLDPWPLLVPHALFDGAKGDRSAWGAVGMGGNASEWATWKPGAPKQVILGGSFIDQNAQATRIGNLSRPPTPIGTRSNNVGFRCVFEFPPNLLATQK
jgi:formylglycine-generating enzyme required for sulfatase activity